MSRKNVWPWTDTPLGNLMVMWEWMAAGCDDTEISEWTKDNPGETRGLPGQPDQKVTIISRNRGTVAKARKALENVPPSIRQKLTPSMLDYVDNQLWAYTDEPNPQDAQTIADLWGGAIAKGLVNGPPRSPMKREAMALKKASKEAVGADEFFLFQLAMLFKTEAKGKPQPEWLAHMLRCRPWLDNDSYFAWVKSRSDLPRIPVEGIGLETALGRAYDMRVLEVLREDQRRRLFVP